MNSKNNIHKLGKTKAHREAVKRNLINSLILFEHVKTTKQKAKSVVGMFDKVVNYAKKTKNALTRERQLKRLLDNENAIAKLQEVLVKRFSKDQGGYLKIYKLGKRKGDNAEVVNILVKGYVYKDIGKKVGQKDKQEVKKEETTKGEKPGFIPEVDIQGKSQVTGTAAVQGKVKSRSGI